MNAERIAVLREWIAKRCCDCRAARQTKFSCQSIACWKTRDDLLALLSALPDPPGKG